MKPLLVTLALFFSLGTLVAQSPTPRPDATGEVSAWLEGLGARREGSASEALVFATVKRWFGERVSVSEAGFAQQDGEHSFSKRLWFRVSGTLPGELVVVVPTDGANHRGLAWAAAWADRALTRGTPVSLIFLFTGAERGNADTRGLGSRTFLQDYYPTVPAAVVYLDTTPGLDVLTITAESAAFPSPLWMVQGLSDALGAQGLPLRFTGTAPSLFRLDLPERRNALEPWFQRSIPGLWLAGGPADEAVVEALVGFTEELKDGVPSYWDRHWLSFDFGLWRAFWGQQTYLTVYLVLAGVLLFGYAVLGRQRRGTVKVLGRGFWQLPVLLAFGFLALSAGTLLSGALMEARGDVDLWKREPLLVWSFKALVAVTLYVLLFLPLRRTPLSREPDFYAQAAFLWLAGMTLAATALELSFSFYFLWALVWSAVLLVVPWRPLKLVALVLGPLWLFKAAYDVLGPQPDLELSRWVLASPLAGNFVLAVLFFPFLLQVNAWHLWGKRHQNRNEGLRAAVQLAAWALLTLGAGLAVLRIEAATAAPVTTPFLRVDLNAPGHPEGLWQVQVSRSAFLDRTVWDLSFTGSVAPEEVELDLVSSDPLTIFDCSFPLVLEPEGHRARIVVGRQPPLPLQLRLTLPQETKARLEWRVMVVDPERLWLTDSVELGP